MELVELNRFILEGHVKADFAIETSQDGNISCLSENDVKILDFVPNVDSDVNCFKFNEYNFKLSDFHIAEHTGVSLSDVIYNLPREDLFEAISNEIFTPKFEDTNILVTKPLSLSWSPKGFHKKILCALATISNSGNVEIFTKSCEKWHCISNLSEILVKHEEGKWAKKNIAGLYQKEVIKLHMERVSNCVATSVCWSPIYQKNGSEFVYVTVGHLDGTIRIWRLHCFDSKDTFPQPELIATKNSTASQITAVHWIRVTNDTGWVIYGDLNGLISAIPVVTMDENTVLLKEEILIFAEPDIRSYKMKHFIVDGRSVVLTIKGQFVVITLLDNQNQEFIRNEFVDMGNYTITGWEQIDENEILVLTLTGVLKSLRIELSDCKDTIIKYNVTVVKSDIAWHPYCAKGLLRSPEKHLWGILVFPCKIFDHLVILKPTEIVFCMDKNLDPGKLLKENSSQRLWGHWELLEIIRCMSIEKKSLPLNWVASLDIFDDVSLYELRIYYWLTVASAKLIPFQKNLDIYEKFADIDLLEKFIYLKYFYEKQRIFSERIEGGQNLEGNEMLSIHFIKKSIFTKINDDCVKDYFSENYLKEVDQLLIKIDNIIDIPVPDCIICNTPLAWGKCDHPDDRCIISNLQLMFNGKYHCKFCHKMAHEHIQEDPFCTLCDIPMLPFDPQLE